MRGERSDRGVAALGAGYRPPVRVRTGLVALPMRADGSMGPLRAGAYQAGPR